MRCLPSPLGDLASHLGMGINSWHVLPQRLAVQYGSHWSHVATGHMRRALSMKHWLSTTQYEKECKISH